MCINLSLQAWADRIGFTIIILFILKNKLNVFLSSDTEEISTSTTLYVNLARTNAGECIANACSTRLQSIHICVL